MEIRRQSRHQRANRKTGNKLIFGTAFLVGMMILFWFNLKDYSDEEEKSIISARDYLPEAKRGTIYHKPYYSISYVEEYEIPEWVSYRLTVDMLNRKKFPRDQDFNPDAVITTQSAHYHDYKNSGYRRGHLVPSADMSWNQEAMDATFLLSNIAPMQETFNDGIWLELEHNVRDWARQHKNIVVVTGPVFSDPITSIGQNEVLVPRYFYKAVLMNDGGVSKSIGFLFDQTIQSTEKLDQFIVPIDSIEKLTGLDLFSNLYGDWDKEIAAEKQVDRESRDWPFNEKWYLERMDIQ